MAFSRHRAPWSGALKMITGLFTAVCLGLPLLFAFGPDDLPVFDWPVALLPVGIWVGCALFMILEYEIAEGELRVRRPLWTTRIPLLAPVVARLDEAALTGAVRLFGNGGAFSFTGWYRSERLGTFRLWANDLRRVVVVETAGKTFVVSPEDPERFAEEIARSGRLVGPR